MASNSEAIDLSSSTSEKRPRDKEVEGSSASKVPKTGTEGFGHVKLVERHAGDKGRLFSCALLPRFDPGRFLLLRDLFCKDVRPWKMPICRKATRICTVNFRPCHRRSGCRFMGSLTDMEGPMSPVNAFVYMAPLSLPQIYFCDTAHNLFN